MALMPIPMHEPLPAAHLAAELYRFLGDIRIRRCLVISDRSTVQPPSDRRLAITDVPYVVALIDGGLPVADMQASWRSAASPPPAVSAAAVISSPSSGSIPARHRGSIGGSICANSPSRPQNYH